MTSGDPAASSGEGGDPLGVHPHKLGANSHPAETEGAGPKDGLCFVGAGARPPRLHNHWPQAPDWRVHVTDGAHPLGNVFSLPHS